MGLLTRAGEYVALSRQRAAEGELPLPRQLVEMGLLGVAHGLGPGYYHLAGFWRRAVPFADKWQHFGGRAYTRRLAQINPERYRGISQHKLAEKAMLAQLGLPSSELLGHASTSGGRTSAGGSLDSGADFARLLARAGVDGVAMKPCEGYGGAGFTLLDVDAQATEGPRVRHRGDPQWLAAADFWDQAVAHRLAGGLVFERVIEQAPDLARFNPSSVNTLRVWVRRAGGQPARVLLAYLRVGRAGAIVDNQSSGGIVVPIDLETGRLGDGLCGTAQRQRFPRHPDHDAPLAGEGIESLAACLDLSRAALDRFPGLGFVGLDVAVSVDGPLLVELNPAPDRQGSAFVDVPTGAVLGA